MAVKDFKKFFKRRGRFMRQPRNDKKIFQRSCDDKSGKSDRKCFRYDESNHLIGECPNPPKDKNQRTFVRGSWSVSSEEDDEKVKNKTCLVAQASSERCLRVDLEPDEWIKDSGCSKHMTGNRKLFTSYKAYNRGKQAHASHKAKNIVSTTRCLELLHMDLFGPSIVHSYKGNRYTLVIADDYSSKAYIILNKHTKKVKESLNVTFDETPSPYKTSPLVDDDLDEEEEAIKVTEKKNLEKDIEDETLEIDKIGTGIETLVYADSDHARDYVDQKSTSGICMFVGYCLTSWFSKKQTALAISTTEAEYVSAGKACQQALWMKQALIDYDKQTALAISTTEAEYVSAGKACQQALWMKQALIDYDVTDISKVDKIKGKKDKTKHENGKSTRNQSRSYGVDAVEDFKEYMLRDYYCWLKLTAVGSG
nr:retrovirus-related Pol polyprotein from transposon TNT 1-94 [Tanacetum cinerariifolium]